jgi:hypothetical protein
MDLELTCRLLLSTHNSHYDVWMFTVNCWALMMVLIPKLPSVYLPSQAILTRVFSSTECGFSESTNSISRNHPTTTNKPLDSLLHLYFMASKAYIVRCLSYQVWFIRDGNTTHIVEQCSSNTGLVTFPGKQDLGLSRSMLKRYLWELGYLPGCYWD